MLPTMDLPFTETPSAASPMPRDEPFPVPNSLEWIVMNERRCDLIQKKNRGGLSPEEQQEYERLQRGAVAALAKAFPAPSLLADELDRIQARLEAQERKKE